MKDLRRALQRRSDRGTPIGSERLRQRVAFELAGGHMRPEETRRRNPGVLMASAAAVMVLLGVGGMMLLSDQDDQGAVATEPSTIPATSATSSAVTTTLAQRPSIEWSEASLPSDIWITSVVEGGEGLIATGCEIETIERTNMNGDRYFEFGEHAAIWTSSDGRSWTQRITDEAARTNAGCISDVARASFGMIAVATGQPAPDGVVWLSDDGVDWERIDPEPMVDRIVNHVEQGQDGTLVAAGWIGLESLVWTSQDGRSWVQVVDDDLAGRAWVQNLQASESGLLMVATDRSSEYFHKPGVWYSSDGTDWSRIPASEFESSDPLTAVEGMFRIQALPDGTWLVGDFTGRIWASDTSMAWELVYEPELVGDLIPGLGWVRTGQRLVTAGFPADVEGVWISIDGGQSWFKDTSSGIPDDVTIDAVFPFGDGLVAIGSTSPPFTAPDPEDESSTRLWIGTWNG